jgi:hypothetical protein
MIEAENRMLSYVGQYTLISIPKKPRFFLDYHV